MGRSLIRRLIFGATVGERRRQHAKRLDGQLPTPEQQRQLARMISEALSQISCTRDIDLANALADAFHNLPVVISWPDFSWSWLLTFLVGLEERYPEVGRHYIAQFDKVVGFRASP